MIIGSCGAWPPEHPLEAGWLLITSMTGSLLLLQDLNRVIWFKDWYLPFFLLFINSFCSRSTLQFSYLRDRLIPPCLISYYILHFFFLDQHLVYLWRDFLFTLIHSGGISRYFPSFVSPPLAEYSFLEVSSAFVFALGALGTLGGLGLLSNPFLGAFGNGLNLHGPKTNQCPLPLIFLS